MRLLDARIDGLTESEANREIERLGRNEVAREEPNSILEFLQRYWTRCLGF